MEACVYVQEYMCTCLCNLNTSYTLHTLWGITHGYTGNLFVPVTIYIHHKYLDAYKSIILTGFPSVYVGTDRPALKYLNKYVKADIAAEWHDIGVELLDVEDEPVLNAIKNNFPGDVNKCTAEMLQLWLARKAEASWNCLIEVLREPNIKLNALAARIEGMLSQGIYWCMHALCTFRVLHVCKCAVQSNILAIDSSHPCNNMQLPTHTKLCLHILLTCCVITNQNKYLK